MEGMDKLEELDLLEFYNKIDEVKISGRNFELSFPLLLTAKLIHEDIFIEILNVLKGLMNDKKSNEYSISKDIQLYEFVSALDTFRFSYIGVKELTIKFRGYVGEDDYQDRWLNETWMGKALRRLNLITSHKRMNTGMVVTLNVDKALEKAKLFREQENANQE
jgi:hypothetical protein